MTAKNSAPASTKVTGVALKGKSLDGTYKIIKIEQAFVIVRHPSLGDLKIPRQNTDLPASAGVTLSYEELLTEIRSRFGVLDDLVDSIIAKTTRSLIVSGAAGVGKSFTVETKLALAKIQGKVRSFKIIRGSLSPINFYMLLWENRHAGDVLVLDDADKLFDSEEGANLVKAATDTGKKRVVAYYKEAHALNENGIPKDFDYQGSVIVATNIDFTREIASESKRSEHLRAVLNRALYLDLGLHSKQSLMARVEDVCRNTKMLHDAGLTDPTQVEAVIGWLKDNQSTVRSLSLRTALHIAGLIQAHPAKWKLHAKMTLLGSNGR